MKIHQLLSGMRMACRKQGGDLTEVRLPWPAVIFLGAAMERELSGEFGGPRILSADGFMHDGIRFIAEHK